MKEIKNLFDIVGGKPKHKGKGKLNEERKKNLLFTEYFSCPHGWLSVDQMANEFDHVIIIPYSNCDIFLAWNNENKIAKIYKGEYR